MMTFAPGRTAVPDLRVASQLGAVVQALYRKRLC
jgi:hypothetical protein